MKAVSIIFFLLFFCGCQTFSPKAVKDIDTSNLFFSDKKVDETHAFHVYKNQYKDEMAKVHYLINLVRYSPLTFSRNGRKVKGHNSGRWLDYKLDMYYREVKTVEDFIEKVGSHSRKSGRLYYVVYDDNKKVPMKVLYYNELKRLYEYEEQCSKSKIMKSVNKSEAVNNKPNLIPPAAVPQVLTKNK